MHKTETQISQGQTFTRMKYIIREGMFSIEPVLKGITKNHLGILSVPGVAKACLHIQGQIQSIDDLTIRKRSVAIVSRGKMFGGFGRYFLPIMDWLVVQVKIFANVDCYPFVIRTEAPLKSILEDLSNSYCGVIFLDDEKIPEVSSTVNYFILSHWDIHRLWKLQFTNMQLTSYILAQLIKKNFSGLPTKQTLYEMAQLGKSRLEERIIDQQIINEHKIIKLSPLQAHQKLKGKINIVSKYNDIEYLRKYFTQKNLIKLVKQKDYGNSSTSRLNAIITDGTAILGLGNIGPASGLPVMQAKSMMFKLLGDVNIVPLCINTRQTPQETVNAILDLVHLYKAINLQDIKAPQCFTIQRTLQKMDIMPVFHDDQHGTAIAALAGLINSTKLAEKKLIDCKIVINGGGAAGLSIAHILHKYGVTNIIVCDTHGAIYQGRQENMNFEKVSVSKYTNLSFLRGQLKDALIGADAFVGVSAKDTFDKQWIKLMNKKPIILSMANPDPQISYEQAMQGGCFIYGSGKSNKPNQITNSLAYPGIFRAVNEHNIKKITDQMQIEAAEQIALIKGNDATRQSILPFSLNKNISIRISQKLKQHS